MRLLRKRLPRPSQRRPRSKEHLNETPHILLERLSLSPRTLNCLKGAGINKVGEVFDVSKDELLQIRNFGEKCYDELFGRLREMDLLPPEITEK